MLLQTLGANAEFVRRISVTSNIKRIASPNLKRQSGLILNRSNADFLIEFASYPHKLLNYPTFAIRVPAKGGNLDIPTNYTGAIWVKWVNQNAQGSLKIHHYYFRK
jgi:hypothetical protein